MSAKQHQKHILRREREIREESCRRIQVREYEGHLYFCFDNIPLLGIESVEPRLENAVKIARDNYADYMQYRSHGQRTHIE